MPAHHNRDRYLEEYILSAGIAQDRKSPLFRTSRDVVASWPSVLCFSQMRGGCFAGELPRQGLKLRSVAILSVRPGLLPDSRTVASLKSLSRWPITRARARLVFTIGETMRSL